MCIMFEEKLPPLLKKDAATGTSKKNEQIDSL